MDEFWLIVSRHFRTALQVTLFDTCTSISDDFASVELFAGIWKGWESIQSSIEYEIYNIVALGP